MDISALFTPFNLTLAVLAVAAVFFMRGKVRADMVALCSLLALMLLGILNPAEALAGFASNVVIMMVGLFVVGAGIFRTGLAKMISGRILKLGGKNENTLFVLVMLVTASIGAFVSNTGTVAVMMPIVISMAASSGMSARRYLMPMAFASSMGMFTLISTPPNIVINEALIEAGHKSLSFFSFAPVGAVALTVGVAVLFFSSRFLKPKESEVKDRKRGKSLSELVEEYNLKTQVHKLSVPESSPLSGHTLSDLKIATEYNISIGKVVRRHPGRRLLQGPPAEEIAGPGTEIRGGDLLYCHGSDQNIERFASENNLTAEEMHKNEQMQNFADYGIAEVFITPNSCLINHTVRDSRFRERYNVNVLGIKRKGDYEIGELKDARMKTGDALLIQGRWNDITALGDYQDDMVLVGQPQKEASKVTLDSKAPVAAVIMLLMIAVMVMNVVPSVTVVMVAAVLMVATGCIRNMEEAYGSINWSSIVLIGAMIPMATAFEKTGVTAAISHGLLEGLGNAGPGIVMMGIYVATMILTMFMSNTATAVLFTPIAIQAAADLGVNPHPFVFAVAVAASMCFASPFSTPPNALVMSAGNYTFMDYVRIGLPLQLIMAVIMVIVLPLIFPF